MKTLSIALACFLTLTGCGRPHLGKSAAPTAVSKFATTPIPVPPPVPDPAPTGQDIAGATGDVTTAQQGLQQVLKIAEATPAAQPAVAPLTAADAHLTAALAKLDSAAKRCTQLSEDLAASEDAHKTAEGIMRKDIDTLKNAATKDGAAATKQITALESQVDDLNNEAMRSAKNRLMWMGVLLLIGAAGSVVASLYLGFLAGPKMAGLMGAAGVFLITLSQLLQKIAFYGECACLAGAVGLCGWLLWHAFHHVPVVLVPAVVKPEVKP